MFDENEDGIFIPRALFCDTDSIAIEELMKTDLGQLLKPEQFVYGKEAANNYSRGHYTIGKEISQECINKIQKLIENCTHIDCILLFHSMSGGTGTGVGSLISYNLGIDYGNVLKILISIMPSEDNSSLVIEPYNCILGFHSFLDSIDLSICFDNQSLYKICEDKLKIEQPSFFDINKLISKYLSSICSSKRFKNQDTFISENSSISLQSEDYGVNMQKIMSSCVPYPRLHTLLTSFSPYIAEMDGHKVEHSVESISKSVLNPDSYMIYFNDETSKSLGSIFSYRGDVLYSDIV